MGAAQRRPPGSERGYPSALGIRLVAAFVVVVAFALRTIVLDRAPPGLHFDEAVYGLLARDIAAGARPVFFSAYTGRETLYMYLLAAMFGAAGQTAFAIRLASAFAGTATVAVAYRLGCVLYGRRVGLVTAALLAANYWHLTVSRNGYPNVLIPAITGLSACFLWRAWQGNLRRDWVLGGALAGLVLHTYLAARFWPVFLGVMGIYGLLTSPGLLRRRLPGVFLALAAGLVVFAPLGLHFLRHPVDFFERANQVLAWRELEGVELLRTYWANARQTAAGAILRGDPRWHFNLPGRPVFLPVVGGWALLGLAICIRRARKLRFGLPLVWIVVFALPGILTLEMQPAGQRIFGVLPALVLLPALGLVEASDWLIARLFELRAPAGFAQGDTTSERWRARRRYQYLAALVLGGSVAVIAAGYACRDYFVRWAQRAETYHIFNADYASVADKAAQDLSEGRTVVLLTEHHKHATIVFLAPETADAAVWADPLLAIPLPTPRGRLDETVYYRIESYLGSDAAATRLLERRATSSVRYEAPVAARGPEGQSLAVTRYLLPSTGGGTEDSRSVSEIAITSAPARVETDRSEEARIEVDWQVNALPGGGRGFAVHLRDREGITWSQADASGYLADQWHPGDRVKQWFDLRLDPEMPPGEYTAVLMLVAEGAGSLPIGFRGAERVEVPVASVEVSAATAHLVAPGAAPQASAGGGLHVYELTRVAAELPPGGHVDVTTRWTRGKPEPTAARVEFRLRSDRGVYELGQWPVADAYEPTEWRAGEIVRGRYRLPIPADQPGGEYSLEMLIVGSDTPVQLGEVSVYGSRTFEAPEAAHATDARFGDTATLVGFDVLPADPEPGGALQLVLHWRAEQTAPPEAKVFAHLLDRNGHLVAQHDGVPARGTRPTGGWMRGEYVRDEHTITLPADLAPGDYLLAVGLYDPASGERRRLMVSGTVEPSGALRLPVVIPIGEEGA